MPQPLRDDEIPDNYLQLRDRGYGPSKPMSSPGDSLRRAIRSGRKRAGEIGGAAVNRADSLRRAIMALIRR